MGRKGKGFGKKDPWEDLSEEFKGRAAGASEEDLDKLVRDAAYYQKRLEEEQKADQDLAQKKEAVKDASAVYRDGIKNCNLQIKYVRQIKKDRGLVLPGDSRAEIVAKIDKTKSLAAGKAGE